MKQISTPLLFIFSFLSINGADPLAVLPKYAPSIEYYESQAKLQEGKTLVFKKLYLGMPITDAMHVITYSLKGSKIGLKYKMNDAGKIYRLYVPGNHAVVYSKDGSVTGIHFSRKIVDILFSSKAMRFDTFIDKFRGAYDIPKLTYRSNPIITKENITKGKSGRAEKLGTQITHYYISPQGYKVTFYEEPTLYDKSKAEKLRWKGKTFYMETSGMTVEKILYDGNNKPGFD